MLLQTVTVIKTSLTQELDKNNSRSTEWEKVFYILAWSQNTITQCYKGEITVAYLIFLRSAKIPSEEKQSEIITLMTFNALIWF